MTAKRSKPRPLYVTLSGIRMPARLLTEAQQSREIARLEGEIEKQERKIFDAKSRLKGFRRRLRMVKSGVVNK